MPTPSTDTLAAPQEPGRSARPEAPVSPSGLSQSAGSPSPGLPSSGLQPSGRPAAGPTSGGAASPPPSGPTRKLLRRAGLVLLGFSGLLVLAVVLFFAYARTENGQSWLCSTTNAALDSALAPSGLQIKLTHLSGALPFEWHLGLTGHDQNGQWLDAPDIVLVWDWKRLPSALRITQLQARGPVLSRLPALLPAVDEEPEPPLTAESLRALLQDLVRTVAGLSSEWPGWAPDWQLDELALVDARLPAELVGGQIVPHQGAETAAEPQTSQAGAAQSETAQSGTGQKEAGQKEAATSRAGQFEKNRSETEQSRTGGAAKGAQASRGLHAVQAAGSATGQAVQAAAVDSQEPPALLLAQFRASLQGKGLLEADRAAAERGAQPAARAEDAQPEAGQDAAGGTVPLSVGSGDRALALRAEVRLLPPDSNSRLAVGNLHTEGAALHLQVQALPEVGPTRSGQDRTDLQLGADLRLKLTRLQGTLPEAECIPQAQVHARLRAALHLQQALVFSLQTEELQVEAGPLSLSGGLQWQSPSADAERGATTQSDLSVASVAGDSGLLPLLSGPLQADVALELQPGPRLLSLGLPSGTQPQAPLTARLLASGPVSRPDLRFSVQCPVLQIAGRPWEKVDLSLAGTSLDWPGLLQLAGQEPQAVAAALELRFAALLDKKDVKLKTALRCAAGATHSDPDSTAPRTSGSKPQSPAAPGTGASGPSVSATGPSGPSRTASAPDASTRAASSEVVSSQAIPLLTAGRRQWTAQLEKLELDAPGVQLRGHLQALLQYDAKDAGAKDGRPEDAGAKDAGAAADSSRLTGGPQNVSPVAGQQGSAAAPATASAAAAGSVVTAGQVPSPASSAQQALRGVLPALPEGWGMRLTGNVQLAFEDGPLLRALAPSGQTMSGKGELSLEFSPHKGQDVAAQWRVARFSLAPEGQDDTAQGLHLRDLSGQARLRDIFRRAELDAALKLAQFRQGPWELSAEAGASGRLSGPLRLEASSRGSVQARLAALWQPGRVDLQEASVFLPGGLPVAAAQSTASGRAEPLGFKLVRQARILYGQALNVQGLELRMLPSGLLRAEGQLSAAKLAARLELQALELGPWKGIVPALPQGEAYATVHLTGSAAQPGGDLRAGVRQLRMEGSPLKPMDVGLAGSIRGKTLSARLELPPETVARLGGKEALAELRLPLLFDARGIPLPAPEGRLTGQLRWLGEAGPLWSLLPLADRRLKGHVDLQADLSGSLSRPRVRGALQLEKARFEGIALGLLLTDITGAVHMDGGLAGGSKGKNTAAGPTGAVRLQLSATDGRGGKLAVEGQCGLDGRQLQLHGSMDHLRPLRRRDLRVNLSGQASVSGSVAAPQVRGEIVLNSGELLLNKLTVTSGVTTLPITTDVQAALAQAKAEAEAGPEAGHGAKTAQGQSSGGRDIQGRSHRKGSAAQQDGRPSEGKGQATAGRNARRQTASGRPAGSLHVVLRSAGRFVVQGYGLSSAWKANLLLNGSPWQPQLTGRLEAQEGMLDFLSKQFELERGIISFEGGALSDPLLNIVMRHEQPEITARISIRGTASKMQLALSSEPQLPRDDILARVLFGRDSNQLGRLESLRLAGAVVELAGLGSGGAGVLDVGRRVLGVDVLRLGQERTGASGTPGEQTAGGTTLEMGKYLGDKIYVGVKQGTRADSTAFVMELELTPSLDLELQTEQNDTWGGLRWKYNY